LTMKQQVLGDAAVNQRVSVDFKEVLLHPNTQESPRKERKSDGRY
jgi:hypothetical protein